MFRLPFWIPLCSMLLLLAPGASHAGRAAAAGVEGYIVHAPTPGDPILVIEAGSESVALRVTRKTELFFSPPQPPGEPSEEPQLEVGRRALASYDRQTHVVLSVGVSREVDVGPVEGHLDAVGPLATVSIRPEGQAGELPAEYLFSDETRLFVNDVPIDATELPLFVNGWVSALRFANTPALERLRVLLGPLVTRVGTIRSLDPETRQLRVASTAGTVDLVLPSGLDLRLGDRTVPLSALRVGDWVRVATADTPAGVQVALAFDLQRLLPRAASGRLTAVDPAAGTLTLKRPGAATFQVPADAPITLQFGDDAPRPITLIELQEAIPQYDRIKLRVEFLVRGKNRLATRVDAVAERQGPPTSAAGG